MTLIIGLKCQEGVVVGSDGAATLGGLGNKTITQPTKKLAILQNKIIIGVSGPVGLGQRITGEIDNLWKTDSLSGKKPFQAMTLISKKIREHLIPEIEVATKTRPLLGNLSLESVITQTLVALPLNRTPLLFQFDHQGSPEEATDDLPFVSIGIGQTIADPFLGFIRRLFWPKSCPNINQGIFAALWTLQHAISISPGGITEPIFITTLKKEGSDWVANECEDLELKEHHEAISEAENSLKHFKDKISEEVEAKKIPEPVESLH